MADDDDIDIVEHDLLDNPLIQKMFPDLSIFKQEIIDFNNEVPTEIIPETCSIIEQQKDDHHIDKDETDNVEIINKAYTSSFPRNPTDKVYSRICLRNNIQQQELHEEYKSPKDTLCCEVVTKNHILMEEKMNVLKNQRVLDNLSELSSWIIEKMCKQNIIESEKLIESEKVIESKKVIESEKVIVSDIESRYPMLVEVLTRPSELQKYKTIQNSKKISYEFDLHKENFNSSPAGSTCSENLKPSYVENHEVDQVDQNKSDETIGSLRNSVLPLKHNKIVIGSKPSVKHIHKKVSDKQNMSKVVKVVVENINTFLSKSTRYCKICCRLFPSNKTLADHKNLVHTLLGDSQPSELIKIASINQSYRYECNICGAKTLNVSDLLRHKRTIHSKNEMNVGKKAENLNNNQSQGEDKLIPEIESFECAHCNNRYASQQLVIDHMYEVIKNINKDISKSSEIEEGKKIDVEKDIPTLFFYKCSFCSCYFDKKRFYIRHVKKHKNIGNFKFEKVAFDPICKHCSNTFCDVNSFNKHVRRCHQMKKKIADVSIDEAGNDPKRLELKQQRRDLQENKIQSNLNMNEKDIKKDESISTMWECSQGKPQNQCILKSALFKCFKCDICFLNAYKAADHVAHMDILINWKCLKCSRFFKKEDELLHSHQHLFTDTFDVCEISDINQLAVLFKCPNCTTYFLEKDFFSHCSVCEMQSPLSAYCKICHNLIDDKIKGLHDMHHKQLPELSILYVESDVITYNGENYRIPALENNTVLEKETINRKQISINETLSEPLDPLKLEKKSEGVPKIPSFSYCIKCRCFVRRTNNLYYHTKGRCTNAIHYVCRFCGLILSNKTITFHRKMHKDVPGLTLRDYKFYDLNSGKVMCPPVPKYPSCKKCEKHFITKTAIISHQCDEDYLTCPVCKIKLSNAAFPLHVSFHNYSSKKGVSGLSNNPPALELPSINLVDSLKKDNIQLLVYVCKTCKIAFDVYNMVIEHCQDHICGQEMEVKTKPCNTCNIIFDITCFENHSMLHVCNCDDDFVVLNFDDFYARAQNNIWLHHLLGTLPQGTIDNILGNSIYKYERRIKMKIIQDGLKCFTFYKCAKCQKYINPKSLYQHCKILCFKLKPLPCSFCGIQFVCKKYLNEHKKIHAVQDVTLTSYRIVLFNCDEDKCNNHALSLPNQYVLYECRNCNGIVDRLDRKNHKCDYDDLAKCSYCGLLICKNDYTRHVLKHKEFCSFNENNMRIILIGQVKNCFKLKHNLVPSFRGVRLDYLMYQCNKCHVCVKDKESSLIHNCPKDTAITKCLKCELYIEDTQFKEHSNFHECNTHFLKENITVVKFGFTIPTLSDDDVIVIEDEDNLEIINNDISEHNKSNEICNVYKSQSDTVIEKIDEIFKCKCGLHFLNKLMGLSHCMTCKDLYPTKQRCSKCGLDFLPSVLYNHLLAHHGTKNISYKFHVIEIS